MISFKIIGFAIVLFTGNWTALGLSSQGLAELTVDEVFSRITSKLWKPGGLACSVDKWSPGCLGGKDSQGHVSVLSWCRLENVPFKLKCLNPLLPEVVEYSGALLQVVGLWRTALRFEVLPCFLVHLCQESTEIQTHGWWLPRFCLNRALHCQAFPAVMNCVPSDCELHRPLFLGVVPCQVFYLSNEKRSCLSWVSVAVIKHHN